MFGAWSLERRETKEGPMRAIGMSILATLLLFPALPAGATVSVQSDAPSAAVADAVGSAASRWERALSARAGCVGSVSITFEDLNARRGEYRTREAKVVIDIAVSASEAPRVAIHELAHHAFVACGGYADASLTSAFYAAQGLPENRGWFDYSAGWAATPAELFAEAMTAVIDGGTAHGVSVTSAAREVVSRWMKAQTLSVPATTTTTVAPTTTTVAAITTTTVRSSTTSTVARTTTTRPSVTTTTTVPPPSRPPVDDEKPPKGPASVRFAVYLAPAPGGIRPRSNQILID